jgi:hypothetical protein
MTGKEICSICGKPGATVAYFATGMAEVVYRHQECDRHGAPRELSPSEERQAWSIDQWLNSEVMPRRDRARVINENDRGGVK